MSKTPKSTKTSKNGGYLTPRQQEDVVKFSKASDRLVRAAKQDPSTATKMLRDAERIGLKK